MRKKGPDVKGKQGCLLVRIRLINNLLPEFMNVWKSKKKSFEFSNYFITAIFNKSNNIISSRPVANARPPGSTDETLTAASLIDAIITHEINRNSTDGRETRAPPKPNLNNRYIAYNVSALYRLILIFYF